MAACAWWTDEQTEYLRTHHRFKSIAEIASAVGKTEKAVQHKAARMNLGKKQAPRSAWNKGLSRPMMKLPEPVRTQHEEVIAIIEHRKRMKFIGGPLTRGWRGTSWR